MAAVVLLTLGMASCERDDDTKWVDLGLPSGLLWATCNLGATNSEDYGDYYAWGETSVKGAYDWSTYRYATVDADCYLQTLTKYNTSDTYGTIDNKTTLEASDDVATAVLGSGARIPTEAEWDELISNTTSELTTLNGVYGWKFTASNGNSLFLPAPGLHYDLDLLYDVEEGHYWSSSLRESKPYIALSFYFNNDPDDSNPKMYGGRRDYGRSVRAVRSRN